MDDNPLKGGFKKKRVFISYGHDEMTAVAGRLKDDLLARGHEVWFDAERIKAGTDWESYIEDGLAWVSEYPREGCFLLIMTPHSVRRPDGFCLNELSRAILLNLKVIPVMLVWCEPPLSICRIQWLSMEDCLPPDERMDRYKAKFNILAGAIEHDKLDFEGMNTHLFNLLNPLSFDAEIKYNLNRFTGRSWVFREIDRWLKDTRAARIFWLSGSPGTGKTAISAWLCAHRPEIVAFHFCRYDNVQKIDPRRCILSIAYQLSTQLPDYQERLKRIKLDHLDDLNAGALFDHLIVQPLSANFPDPGRVILFLIDGLDEATIDGKNELASLLASQFERTPEWLRLIITSRPEPEILGLLQAYSPFLLDVQDPKNYADIAEFLKRELRIINSGQDVAPDIIGQIMKNSDGLFIYAEWILRELANRRLSLDRLQEFPKGLGGVYLNFFQRQFHDSSEWESRVCPALEVIASSQEPVTGEALRSIFGWGIHEERSFRRSLGSLFVIDRNGLRPFHHSVLEWLMDEDKNDPYFISAAEGHRILADHGMKEYRKGPGEWSPYTIMYLPLHLCLSQNWRALEGILGDARFIRAAWAKDKYNLMRLWTFIEGHSPVTMAGVYRPLVNSPGNAGMEDLRSVAGLLQNMFRVEEALRLLEFLAAYYRRGGESAGLQKVLGDRANLLILKCDYDGAVRLLKEQEAICRESVNMDGLQSSLYDQAKILLYKNYFDASMALFKEQEAICRSTGNVEGLQRSLIDQALIFRARGEYDSCLALLKEQEKIGLETGNIDGLQESLGGQGLVLTMMGALDIAMEKLKEQEKLCRRIGNMDGLRNSLGSQGVILQWRGDLDGAMALFKEEGIICRKIGHKFGVAESIGDQAIILRLKGDLDGALALLKQRESISRDLEDKYGLEFALRNEAIILRLKGDLDGALALHKEEERICREIGHKRDLAVSLCNQGIVRYAKGDIDGSLALYGEAEGMLRKMGFLYGLQECLGEKAIALLGRGDGELALVCLEEQEKICLGMKLKPDLEKCRRVKGAVMSAMAAKAPALVK